MKQEVIDLIRRALAGSMPMLVLRGSDTHARVGGDIDILVPSREALRACLLLADAARIAGWRLAGFRDIGYLAQVVLVRPGNEKEDEAIKIDFFAGFEWYGVGSDAISRRFFKIVQEAGGTAERVDQLAAAVNFIQKCLIVGRLSERDWGRVAEGGATPEFLVELAQSLGLPLSAYDIERKGVSGFRQWRLRAASAGVGGLIGFAFWFPRAALAHLWSKLGVGTHWGHSIGLSGLDGSGKSTQMERLFAAYRRAGGEQPLLVHLLPGWMPLPHQLFRRTKTEQNYTRPYAEAPVQSRWSGLLRLFYYLVAFSVAKWWMRGVTLRGQVIVLDRSFLDFSADLTRSRIPDFRLPVWLIRLCGPRGTLLFLDALPATVVRRKGELQLDKATDLRQRYLSMFKQVNGAVIDAESTPDIVFADVLNQIDAIYRARLAAAAA
jgi:thymidylate kinase